MNIGNVQQKEYKAKDQSIIKWLEVAIRVPFGSCTLTLTKVKEKTQDNSPDYSLYFSPNRKGESLDRNKVGSLWMKTSEKGNAYMSGYIESPLLTNGKIYISIVKYQALEGMPVQNILYNVLWSPEEKQKEYSDYQQNYTHTSSFEAPTTTTTAVPVVMDIEEDEIPF